VRDKPGFWGSTVTRQDPPLERRVVLMQVGRATVRVEQVGAPLKIQTDE
jgi:hypothetical protein